MKKGISCLLIIITVFGVLFLVSEDTGVIRNEFLDVPVHSDESTTPENIKIIQETTISFCSSQYFSAHHVCSLNTILLSFFYSLLGKGGEHEWIGDGFCDDINNNKYCNFDNGDCCGTCVNVDYCSLCECLSAETVNGISNAFVGNGICNDETNTINCGFDGFDCCQLDITQDHCSECSCHTSKYLLFE